MHLICHPEPEHAGGEDLLNGQNGIIEQCEVDPDSVLVYAEQQNTVYTYR